MSEANIETAWEFYDSARHGAQGGNYIFLLRSFMNAPYYSGETQNFADRFVANGKSHERLFRDGMRTFMRRPFIEGATEKTHHGFAARWHHYKQQSAEEQAKLVWVPTGSSNEEMGREGTPFWKDEVVRLVSIRGENRHDVEKRIQVDIMDYYDGLLGRSIDWCIPKRSRLVGHGPGVVTQPNLLYRLDGGQAQDASTFFDALTA